LSSQVLTENGGAKAICVVTFALGFIVVVEVLAIAIRVLGADVKVLVTDVKVLVVDVKVLAVEVKVLAVDVAVLAEDVKVLGTGVKVLTVNVKVVAVDVKVLALVVGILLVVIIGESVAVIVSDGLLASIVDASVDVNEAEESLIDVGGVNDTVDSVAAAFVAPLQNYSFVLDNKIV
jgi:hypothetical protein